MNKFNKLIFTIAFINLFSLVGSAQKIAADSL